MAYGILPQAGTDLGPCMDEDCGHIDCDETRRQARSECRLCGDVIGYGRRFNVDSERPGGFVHWACLLETAKN